VQSDWRGGTTDRRILMLASCWWVWRVGYWASKKRQHPINKVLVCNR
jgi:hypothetical protein